MPYRAIVHASELITGEGIRSKDGRGVSEPDLGSIPDGALVYGYRVDAGREIPEKIEWVGESGKLPERFSRASRTDLQGKKALVPGFIDCHTHMVFAGDRSEEFALRCAGATYEEIAARGGGILTTVKATRAASSEELEALASARVEESASFGVRTLEIKSGYGLSIESEIRSLEVIQKLKARHPGMTIIPTFLGAHALPHDRDRELYVQEIIEEMLPEVADRRLADHCDVFVDEGYYTSQEARAILKTAVSLGLKVKLHADELGNTESAALGVELGALSVDHLLRISNDGIKELARSNTVAVLLPGTAFYLKAPHAPARKLIDAGAVVALSTDFNPGSCPCNSLPAIMTIAALYLGMSRPEILAAVTYNAAKALGLEGRKGTLQPGLDADFTVLPFERFEQSYYRFGWR